MLRVQRKAGPAVNILRRGCAARTRRKARFNVKRRVFERIGSDVCVAVCESAQIASPALGAACAWQVRRFDYSAGRPFAPRMRRISA
jgi:hypothetical protein